MFKKLILTIVAFGALQCFAQSQFSPFSTSTTSKKGSFSGGMVFFAPPLQNVGNKYLRLGMTQIVASDDAHTHNIVTDEAVAATCTKDGLSEGTHCSVCHMILKEQTVIPAKGHKIAIDLSVDSTSSDNIFVLAGARCAVCGSIIVPQFKLQIIGQTIVIDTTIVANGSTVRIDTTIILNRPLPTDTTIVVGIADVNRLATVFPNPATDFINIDADDDCICLIYNDKGNAVLRRKLSNGKQINISGLVPGNYILELIKNNISITSIKFIKQ